MIAVSEPMNSVADIDHVLTTEQRPPLAAR
jgi:hypothetical protein